MSPGHIFLRTHFPTTPVPKQSGAVHICVDLKALNESALHKVYPLPTVDDLLGQLTGATIFSRLDTDSGF